MATRVIDPAGAGARSVIEAAAGRPEIMVMMVVVAMVGVVVVPTVQIQPEGVAGHVDAADGLQAKQLWQ